MTVSIPLAAPAGGALTGLAAVLPMVLFGRIAACLLPPVERPGLGEGAALILRLVAAPGPISRPSGAWPAVRHRGRTGAAGRLGLAVWGFGCTSGHGVCGLSPHSLVAMLLFVAAAPRPGRTAPGPAPR